MAKSLSLKDLLTDDEAGKKVGELSFEAGIKLLEELVEKVESGSLPLDKAVTSYEKGVALVSHLRGQLSGAEEKLKVLQKGSGS